MIANAVHRRAALRFLAGLAVALPAGAVTRSGPLPARPINAARLRRSLEGLSVFGRPAGGGFAAGVSRVAYSAADIAGRAFAIERMREAGLAPTIDAAGNIIARRPGADDLLKPILIGSHVDTVPGGGNFDGNLGAMAAIEVAHSLGEQRITTRHPLEVVIRSDEEGYTMGSAAAVGEAHPDSRDPVSQAGIAARAGLRRIGGDPDRLADARRAPGTTAAISNCTSSRAASSTGRGFRSAWSRVSSASINMT